MRDKIKNRQYLTRLLKKYRFVIMTENAFEEKFVVRFSKLSFISVLFLFFLCCFFCAVFLIAYTPLGGHVPGKSTKEVQKSLVSLALKSDSLERAIVRQDLYLKNLKKIISGEEVYTESLDTAARNTVEENISFEKSKEDSLFRISVESENTGSLYVGEGEKTDFVLFFPPVKGLISDAFNKVGRHFGVDVLAKENTRISSVLEGRVVVSHWAAETGYVIAIQHKNDYLSVYKHNSVLLKKQGDFVAAGEHVAIIGNSGELSSGPHLHFELWHKGVAVNPENYISF